MEEKDKQLELRISMKLARSLGNLDTDFRNIKQELKKSDKAPSLTDKIPELNISGNYYDLCSLVRFLKICRQASLDLAKINKESD